MTHVARSGLRATQRSGPVGVALSVAVLTGPCRFLLPAGVRRAIRTRAVAETERQLRRMAEERLDLLLVAPDAAIDAVEREIARWRAVKAMLAPPANAVREAITIPSEPPP